MGDDLNAALDAKAPSYWAGREVGVGPKWPKGAEPLAKLIKAPPELAATLAFTAVVEVADGPRLQALLEPGARLVSKHGDLWRWDGFVARAEAPRPAAIRLEQRRRLAEIEAEIERLSPAATEAERGPSGGKPRPCAPPRKPCAPPARRRRRPNARSVWPATRSSATAANWPAATPAPNRWTRPSPASRPNGGKPRPP